MHCNVSPNVSVSSMTRSAPRCGTTITPSHDLDSGQQLPPAGATMQGITDETLPMTCAVALTPSSVMEATVQVCHDLVEQAARQSKEIPELAGLGIPTMSSQPDKGFIPIMRPLSLSRTFLFPTSKVQILERENEHGIHLDHHQRGHQDQWDQCPFTLFSPCLCWTGPPSE